MKKAEAFAGLCYETLSEYSVSTAMDGSHVYEVKSTTTRKFRSGKLLVEKVLEFYFLS